MIMSSYFNVFAPKIIRIYADIVQNHTLPGVIPNFWRAVYDNPNPNADKNSFETVKKGIKWPSFSMDKVEMFLLLLFLLRHICTVPSTNIGTLGKYEQRRLWK